MTEDQLGPQRPAPADTAGIAAGPVRGKVVRPDAAAGVPAHGGPAYLDNLSRSDPPRCSGGAAAVMHFRSVSERGGAPGWRGEGTGGGGNPG